MRNTHRLYPISLLTLSLSALTTTALAQTLPPIPKVYSNLAYDSNNKLVVTAPSGNLPLQDETPLFTTKQLRGNPEGTSDGFIFNFVDSDYNLAVNGGTLFFALIDLQQQYPLPKYRYSVPIDQNGRAHVDMNGTLNGQKDFIQWTEYGFGHLYYRVQAADGEILYEGMFAFEADSVQGPYQVVQDSIVEGPMVEKVTSAGATISFETLTSVDAQVCIKRPARRCFASDGPATRHEIELTNLQPNTYYDYSVVTENDLQTFGFQTAPQKGSREPFTFAFGSDSRHGIDSGERHAEGVNLYMMQRIMPVVLRRKAAFMQFTGDMINGYNSAPKLQELQYINWKRAVAPFAAYLPMFVTTGNHEVVVHDFDDGSRFGLEIARFPFATEGPGAVFAKHFANFENGPDSEDGSALDPSRATTDFPSYKETVYDYTWGNIAMIALNSDYLYSPYLSDSGDPLVGGNIHGYLMDNQLAWLEEKLDQYQQDDDIDHVFLTVHTPIFPNGGHVSDDMFYDGDNSHRPVIAGKPAAKGIIQRRDDLLRTILSHDKVIAVLAGDEHNYSRVLVGPGMPLYAENGYQPSNPVEITRTFHHITNGATGAPYYGIDPAPWHVGYTPERGRGDYLKRFSTQFAIVFVHVDGEKVSLEVIDPETLGVIEQIGPAFN